MLRNFWQGIHINRVIRILTFSDLLIWSGFGLVAPVFAIFAAERIQGGSLEVAGFAAAVYLGAKSLFQIPIARGIDLRRGERDDYRVLYWGALIVGLVPFGYLLVSQPAHLYIIQAIYGLGNAAVFVSWDAIFTRHLDKGEVALEWSIYYTLVDLGGAVAAALGGIIAQIVGFDQLFFLAGVLSLSGALSLFWLMRRPS